MKSLLTALNLFIFLVAVLAVVLITGEDPGNLAVTWQGWEAETTAAIGATTLLILLACAFYLGQFFSWLARLPATIRNWFRPAPAKPEMETLLKALALHQTGDEKTSLKLVEQANPRPEEETLEGYARLTLNIADPAEIDGWCKNPTLGPLAHMVKARNAAARGEWDVVKTVAKAGLDSYGKLPVLQILYLKALLNKGDNAAAANFLPQLKPAVPTPTWPLLETAIKGPTSTEAATLDNPWFQSFNTWLTTAQTTLPGYEPKTSKRS